MTEIPMNAEKYVMRDPTAETASEMRERLAPPADLSTATVGLLSISKERSSEFLDTLEHRLAARGLEVLRFAKPTHTKPAPEGVLQELIERCDVVVEALAD
jgi:hypothetical protein